MSNQFKGKKLLVVGGTSGMGLQTARTVLAEGGSVVIVGNRPEKTEAARKELAELGQVWALTADLSNDAGAAFGYRPAGQCRWRVLSQAIPRAFAS
ncbi:Short-chain dehydrogenase/reductase SDR [Pseudomonas sp. LBUM920]|nr:Short-chain dehydrogenase/reductase SDR [Pseudomonas sp. LBUM920]